MWDGVLGARVRDGFCGWDDGLVWDGLGRGVGDAGLSTWVCFFGGVGRERSVCVCVCVYIFSNSKGGGARSSL